MNKEEQEQQPGEKKVEILCNDRTKMIIENILLPHVKTDAFSRITMDSVATSGENGLPVNVFMSGNDRDGRASYVSNHACTMIAIELSDIQGKEFRNFTAFVVNIDGEGKRMPSPPDHNGRTILQFTVGCSNVMIFMSALMAALSPTFSKGCELATDAYMINEEPEPNPEDEESVDSQQDPETGEPIPFPKSDVVTDPAPTH